MLSESGDREFVKPASKDLEYLKKWRFVLLLVLILISSRRM